MNKAESVAPVLSNALVPYGSQPRPNAPSEAGSHVSTSSRSSNRDDDARSVIKHLRKHHLEPGRLPIKTPSSSTTKLVFIPAKVRRSRMNFGVGQKHLRKYHPGQLLNLLQKLRPEHFPKRLLKHPRREAPTAMPLVIRKDTTDDEGIRSQSSGPAYRPPESGRSAAKAPSEAPSRVASRASSRAPTRAPWEAPSRAPEYLPKRLLEHVSMLHLTHLHGPLPKRPIEHHPKPPPTPSLTEPPTAARWSCTTRAPQPTATTTTTAKTTPAA
jgi:hypothetical protein